MLVAYPILHNDFKKVHVSEISAPVLGICTRKYKYRYIVQMLNTDQLNVKLQNKTVSNFLNEYC